jgi:hypothetical protein
MLHGGRYIFDEVTLAAGDSSVGIATCYGLNGPGSNPGGNEILRTHPDRPRDRTSLLFYVQWVFPGGKAAGVYCWPPAAF